MRVENTKKIGGNQPFKRAATGSGIASNDMAVNTNTQESKFYIFLFDA
ncbi:MAG: hypothetical protein HY960_12905 [Ignavibacteriae bacterium]|nr:hypothetical protein [Ignavibacteriota bacterium]